jgi:hypothetical protein
MAEQPSCFIGTLKLVPEDKHKGQVELTSDERQVWALAAPFGYRTKAGDVITCPAGMSTDLASIPRLARSALAPDGPWVRAAVIHDCLYRRRGGLDLWRGKRVISRAAPYTRAEADQILDDAMADLNVPKWQRLTIWAAVRAGGQAGWGK